MRSLFIIAVIIALLLFPSSVATGGEANSQTIQAGTKIAGDWDWYWYYFWRAIYEAQEYIRSKKPPALSCPAPPQVALFYFLYRHRAINLNFFNLVNFFIPASVLAAKERLRNFLEYTSLTGRRPRVYLAPSWELLCSPARRFKSTVMPV